MTSSQTRATTDPSPPLPTRSLFSRLRLPLSSKSRNYIQFSIQSDDPHRQYVPGDIVSGSVILKLAKPLRITHLVVSLHGYAQVFKNPNSPGDAYKNYCSTAVGSGKGKKGGNYFGNGFVSLFEDEVVLCGEGRLGEGVFHFNFELEFPAQGLPSSIDFERGTICYMLTATLTRPTTISPTMSCDTGVSLVETIDIAPIPEPKPRVISLEPISRRTRAKTPRKRPDATITEGPPPTTSSVEPPRSGRTDPNSTADEADCPRSPSPSEISNESQMSSGNASGTEYGIRSVNTATEKLFPQNGSRAALKGKTITATINVLKGGVLRGDQIPIRVTVNHTKHVRSLKGIIITLYRQARVDMHPALPVVANSKGDKKKTEDYYPKSRTGLGGLSLSSAGSSHLFRKDLSQSFAPLFVDPRTLTAEIKCAVRVPDEAFPTISNVPGAMISFKYYVEVVVDIQGKLTGLDRMVANAGLVNVPTSGGIAGMARDDATSTMFSTWGGNFVDTDQIRREKGVISSLFEVIIGTKDSERNGKRKQTQAVEVPINPLEEPITPYHDLNATDDYDQNYYDYDENGQYYDYGYDPAYYEAPGYEQHSARGEPSYYAPPRPTEDDQGLSEKERIQRAEARLLPSQPPGAAGASLSGAVQQGIPPSAPVLDEDDDPYPPYQAAGPSSSQQTRPPPPFRAASNSSLPIQHRSAGIGNEDRRAPTTVSNTIVNVNHGSVAMPSASDDHAKPLPPIPPQSPSSTSDAAPHYSPTSSSHVQPTDDKQEMQRRRLELERSAPPEEQEIDPSRWQGPPAPPMDGMQGLNLAPSAPVLDDEDEGLVDAVRQARNAVRSNGQDDRRVSETLPEYQR